ncbi:MAG: 2,3-cyclic 3-phosphodiesterase [Acidobacteriota bacterium]|jgi:2'-5' RNA ligase|nr:2,3-cyclic 3-phosphodiesterase [Acidobacteriota bacterium]
MTQTDEQKSLRLFCAVELPTDVRARAAAHAARLRAGVATPLKVSWEREEKLHLTLKFLGDLAPERSEQLARAVARAATRIPLFEGRLEGTGVFPAPSRPHVLWLGVHDATGKLAALQAAVEEECARADFPRDPRPFHAHVTLARLRDTRGDARRLARQYLKLGFEPVSFPIGEIVLMRSELGAGGSTYTALSRETLWGEVGG